MTFRIRQAFSSGGRNFQPGELVVDPNWRNLRAMLAVFMIEQAPDAEPLPLLTKPLRSGKDLK